MRRQRCKGKMEGEIGEEEEGKGDKGKDGKGS